jgi:hypothetical protein
MRHASATAKPSESTPTKTPPPPAPDVHLAHLLQLFTELSANVSRIADVLDPPPPDIVGTPYVAGKLGCTTTWIADLIRLRQTPSGCLVPGTGGSWKFLRARIDR